MRGLGPGFFVAGACFGALGVVVERGRSSESDDGKPDVLLTLADDVGQEVLSRYRGATYKTANSDRIAASGLRFQYALSGGIPKLEGSEARHAISRSHSPTRVVAAVVRR